VTERSAFVRVASVRHVRRRSSDPPRQLLCFLLTTFAGWVNRHQQRIFDYVLEENRALRRKLNRGIDMIVKKAHSLAKKPCTSSQFCVYG